MDGLNWQAQADGISVRVWAQPGASKTAIVGIQGDALKIALQARPVEGAANEALIKALAAWFDLRKTQVVIRHGAQQRQKLVVLQGDPERLAARLKELLP